MRGRPTRGPARGAWILAGGLVSAAALSGAALLSGNDPELLGAATVARAAGEVSDGIVAEWRRLATSGAILDGPANERFEWTGSPRAHVPPTPLASLKTKDAAEVQVFDLLMTEARRQRLAGKIEGARGLVADALDRQHDDGRAIEAHLMTLQLAAASGDAQGAWAAWDALSAKATPGIARDQVSVLLQGASAGLPVWSADPAFEERTTHVVQAMTTAWTSGELALPGVDETELGPTALLAGADPMRSALRRELERFGADAAALHDAEERARAAAFLDLVDDADARDTGFPLFGRSLGDHIGLIARPTPDGRQRGRIAHRDTIHNEIRRAAADQIPDGFLVDFDGSASEQGEPVRGRTALLGDELGFSLRHVDPAALAASETNRMGALRIGLGVLALLVGATSVVTWRALRREERLADLRSGFVASVSHELRTPLASILLMAENLEEARVPEASKGRYHALIRREALRLRRLVDDVLDVSRLERGEAPRHAAEDVRVDAFFEALESDARERAESAGGTLTFRADDLPDRLHVDGEALRRAVLNLVDNAVKHSGETAVELDVARREDDLVLGVRDRGRGVPSAKREEIFAPFARVNGTGVAEGANAPGAGLGLAIVREIARAHGGSAHLVTPDDGPGARFEIRIPIEPATHGGPGGPSGRGDER